MPRKSKPPPPRPVALITGASAGIGRELALAFAAHGFDLVVVARRRARLASLRRQVESAHGVRVRILQADLHDPEAAGRLQKSLARTPVDVLVNNAGTLEGGTFAGMDSTRIGQMLQLNVGTLVALTHAFLPGMLRRNHGRIVNLASIAAFAPVPWMAVYAATKAFVLSFSEALDEELRGTGVSVTAVCPGLTNSEMADAALELVAGSHEVTSCGDARASFTCDDGAVVVNGHPAKPSASLRPGDKIAIGFPHRSLVIELLAVGLIIAWVLYLSLPFSVHPSWVILPFAIGFGLAVTVTASTFKKYL